MSTGNEPTDRLAARQQAYQDEVRARWLQESAAAFDGQAERHDRDGHPLSEIMTAPGAGATWKR